MNDRSKALGDAIVVLEELYREQGELQTKHKSIKDWHAVRKIMFVRNGIRHSINALKKLKNEKITVV